MKLVNKSVAICVLVVLTMCAIAPAVSATDYSQVEKTSESGLSNSSYGILAPIVHIDKSQVTINYIGTSTTSEAVGKDVGYMIGAYWAIVNKYPEVGDLVITDEDIHENPVVTYTCLKSWVANLNINDTGAGERVMLKVLTTAKTLGMPTENMADTQQNIDPQTAVSAIKMATGATPAIYITGADIWGIYSQQNWTLSHPVPGTKFPIYDVKDLGKIASVGNPNDLLLNHVLGGSLTQTTISITPDGTWSLYVWHAIVYSNGTLEIAEFKTSPFTYIILPKTYPVPADATYP